MNVRRLLYFSLCMASGLGLVSSAHGQGVNTSDPTLPPNGVYLSPGDVHAMYTGANLAIVLSAIQHQPFKDLPPRYDPPGVPVQNELHDFGSQLTGQGQCVGVGCASMGIPPTFPVLMNGRVQTVALNKGPSNTTGVFQTEMLAMSLTGGGGIMIRESPTLPSVGLTSIQPIGGGMYHIDSFFDVFTELSLDGGANWIPSTGPTHVTLVPEPTSVALMAMALLGFVGFARRRG